LPWSWAVERLKKSRQYWMATTRPDGTPHLMIIWGLWFDDSFWFSTGSASRKARNLAANPKCAIGTDDAAKAVILEGAVELVDPKHAEYEQFTKAYEKKYRSPFIACNRDLGSASSRRSSSRPRRGGVLSKRSPGEV
jgi:pyridoxine/pyridoxamine 5'-phosphate oxidase